MAANYITANLVRVTPSSIKWPEIIRLDLGPAGSKAGTVLTSPNKVVCSRKLGKQDKYERKERKARLVCKKGKRDKYVRKESKISM